MATQFPIQSFNYINYQTQHRIPNTIVYDKQGAVAKTNPFLVKGGLDRTGPDKKFNTLTKALSVRKSPQFYSMRKCKRHHSYTGPDLSTSQKKLTNLLDFEQPLYENLTDSIQICEEIPIENDANVSLIKFNTHDSDTNSSGNNNSGKKARVYGPSHEHLSIHRSDSGISNSSYEFLPQSTPRINPHSKTKRNHLTTPVYINVPFVSSSVNNFESSSKPFNNDGSNEVSVHIFILKLIG